MTRTLDVRSTLQRGGKPFPQIMAALRLLAPGDRLLLLTPFLPSPLIEKLQSEGYSARPERQADGSWQTCVTRD